MLATSTPSTCWLAASNRGAPSDPATDVAPEVHTTCGGGHGGDDASDLDSAGGADGNGGAPGRRPNRLTCVAPQQADTQEVSWSRGPKRAWREGQISTCDHNAMSCRPTLRCASDARVVLALGSVTAGNFAETLSLQVQGNGLSTLHSH